MLKRTIIGLTPIIIYTSASQVTGFHFGTKQRAGEGISAFCRRRAWNLRSLAWISL
ncbi:MAG: hypothetical protein ACOYK8_07885 [Alphaproteobacteria bacterium]